MGIFVRSEAEFPRALAGVTNAGMEAVILDSSTLSAPGRVAICDMHRAKGLEYRAVVVAACDEDIIPLRSRVEAIGDEADLQDVHDTERHLLYVACTRARDHLLITGIDPGSEFLEDMR